MKTPAPDLRLWRTRVLGVGFFAALAALGLRAQETAQNAIALPPFLVEAKGTGRPWRYARSPEFEILSRVPDATTRDIARSYHRLHRLLDVVLPEQFQVKFDVPKTLIVYDESLLPSTTAAIFAEARAAGSAPTPDSGSLGSRVHSVLRNPRLCDLDVMTVFVAVPPETFYADSAAPMAVDNNRIVYRDYRQGWTSLTPNYVDYLVTQRTPPLPTWFVSGFTDLYRKMHFSNDAIEVGTLTWLSESETRALRRSGIAPALLPLGKFFTGPMTDAREASLWFAQAELLVRWALADQKGEWRAPFWKFLERCSTEPAGETLFQECFGFNFAHAENLLKQCLMTSIARAIAWHAEGSTTLMISFRDATPSEIGRIKGDWERMATGYVRSNSPALETPYLDQARRTFQRAYGRGERDAGLLAAMGLCEFEAGNEALAREHLESALQAQVARPRAYLELARLRLVERRTKLATSLAKLDSEQTRYVLEPLLIASRQSPPLPQVFELIADVWGASANPPQRADFAVLEEGIRFFPRNTTLLLQTARLYRAQNFSDDADRLATLGLRAAPSDGTREQLRQLLKPQP